MSGSCAGSILEHSGHFRGMARTFPVCFRTFLGYLRTSLRKIQEMPSDFPETPRKWFGIFPGHVRDIFENITEVSRTYPDVSGKCPGALLTKYGSPDLWLPKCGPQSPVTKCGSPDPCLKQCDPPATLLRKCGSPDSWFAKFGPRTSRRVREKSI